MRTVINHLLRPDLNMQNFGDGYFSFSEMKMVEENKLIIAFNLKSLDTVYLMNFLGKGHLSINSQNSYYNTKIFFNTFQLI